jgi:hypothetical protein
VKFEVRCQKIGGSVSIAHVKRNVIQLLYLHLPSLF